MKIALCCIAKCENLYLSEWVKHHLNLGFDHIYIYDNNDIKGERCADVIGDNQKVTVLTKFLGKKQKGCETQIGAYNDFYKTFGKKYDWVLFSDVDEFLVLNKHTNVNDYISSITDKKTKCVKLNWKCYGDNEQLHYENKPVVERFTKECDNMEENRFYKSFYKTKISGFELINVHYSLYVSTIVDCDGNEMKYEKNVKTKTVNTNSAYFAHYVTKSTDEYYQIKKKRRSEGISNSRLSVEHYFKYNIRTKEKEDYLLTLFGSSKNNTENAKETINYPFGVSVCISAWKTSAYIEECLDSVSNQTWFKDRDNWEILLGIDGCEETLAKVKSIMHKYKNLKVYMMEKNVGTYVTCNTIMREARYEWILRFDGDDVMYPNMVETIMKKGNGYDAIQLHCQNFGIKKDISFSYGVILIKHNIINNFNGYRDWKCDGDNDLLHRIKPHIKYLKIDDILFKRRCHKESLTINEKTNFNSSIKKEHQTFIQNSSNYNTYNKCVLPNYITSTHHIITDSEPIIVTFTSWKKRIQNCSHIIDLMNGQTLKPNKIILNLSTDEFQNKEKDLPKELLEKQNNIFEIHWVKENTKAYKKIMPTLELYPDDVIISIDDDIEYPLDFIEHIYNEYVSFGKKVPITSGEYKWKNDIYTHYGCFSLIKKEFVGDYLNDLYANVVLKNGIDKVPFCDPIITYAVLLNGLRYRVTPYYNMSVVRRNSPIDKQNRLSELGNDKYKKAMSDEHAIIQKYILEKYKKTYDEMFDAQIIVNITTWTKRDWCLYSMLKHLKNQTLHPDKIVLWLSHEEYDKDNLPQTIQKCIDEKLLTDVMWVEKNTYCHKRFACFEHFRNSYNIFLDDDILYENDFIKEIYNNSKMHQDCVTVYSTRSCEYDGYSIIQNDVIKTPSHKNLFMGGRCCFPPYIIPEDVLTKNIDLRDVYVKKCDESWLRPFLIRHDIKVFSMYTFMKEKKFITIDGTQECAVWNENKQVFNGVREKERNFFNAIKITHTEKLCKSIWKNISIDNWKLTQPNRQ